MIEQVRSTAFLLIVGSNPCQGVSCQEFFLRNVCNAVVYDLLCIVIVNMKDNVYLNDKKLILLTDSTQF
jgi:hypothetical protein